MAKGKKLRVVVADDEAHIRKMMKTVMASMKAEIVGEAKNGQEAVEVYDREEPNLLLLDVNMPVMTGEEALEEIMGKHPDAFIIMLTGATDIETIEKCLNLGASYYIRKDTPVGEMKKIIGEAWLQFRKEKAK